MQNPRTLSIFGYILKHEAVEGASQTDNLDWINVVRVQFFLTIIEILSKKRWKQKLWTENI